MMEVLYHLLTNDHGEMTVLVTFFADTWQALRLSFSRWMR